MWHIAAEPSEPSTSTFNEEDYEEHEDTEEEARRRDWVERRWALWEELLSPEAEFAVESLAPGEEEPVVSQESFEKLNPKWQEEHRKKLLEEAKWKEKVRKPLTLEGNWPPPGWKVDAKELAFIREAHSLENVWVKSDDLKDAVEHESMEGVFPRWQMFLKQYDEWVTANKERLDREAQEVDPEYYPGMHRLGEDYREGMYELPFIYPGQHYWGVVSCVSLYEGAFVHIGAVHDGWVPTQDNDWYYIQDFIKVGMHVQVEVIAKRDPYRFRFPIELRFLWQLYQAEEMVLDEEDGVEEDTEYIGLVDDAYSDADDGYDEEGEEEDNEEEYPGYEETFEHSGLKEVQEDVIFLLLSWNSSVCGRKPWLKERSLYLPRTDWTAVEELNVMHNERKLAEKEALMRDTACRIELGLPLEEPGQLDHIFGSVFEGSDMLTMGVNMDLGFLFVCSVIWGLWVSVEGKEEDEEEVDELDRAELATVLQKVKEERGTVNGTATIRMDNIRGMFSRAAEENELGEQDKGDEGDDADEPSTNM
ncbi:hypothetical protein BDL97_02G121700 [Sphagnum fallax]|nr:hypothetical protein BDL97_02G121700 [Sphagnum fallax]